VAAVHVLEFPLVTLVRHSGLSEQSAWANVLMVLNSAVWAGAAYLVAWAAKRRTAAGQRARA
jgi:hypothetical protein